MADIVSEPERAVGVVALVVSVSNIAWGWWRDGKRKAAVDATESVLAKETADMLEKQTAEVARIAADLATHKLEVARDYVTTLALERTEIRLLHAITGQTEAMNKLAERFDRALDRVSNG